MKLLGWMHRKFRQNSNEIVKDFSIGNSCTCPTGQPSLDGLKCYPKTNYCDMAFSKAQREHQIRNSFANLEAAREEEEDNTEEESSGAVTELFHGFLAIGTLGTEAVTTGPSTPTFSISVDHITEKQTEVTEDELKLINDELEKVLRTEDGDEICAFSSGRNSHVSAGRNSHVSVGRSSNGSTFTLVGDHIGGAENNGNASIICPLQSYLFGSAIETGQQEKKEHRASLGELFQKTKLEEETSGAKSDREVKQTDRENDKSAANLMKRILKKRMLHASPSSSGGTVDQTAETKLHKILRMFHRKVHPERTAVKNRFRKPTKNEIKNNILHPGASNSRDLVPEARDITRQEAISKANIWSCKRQPYPPSFMLSSGDASRNSEYWIRTDSDYLVLEL